MKGEFVEKETVTAVLGRLAREKFNLSDSYQTYLNALMDADAAVSEMPAADVAPVRHGWWQITDAYPHNVYCSECHKRFAQTHWAVWEDGSLPREYCPNCGAKMDADKKARAVIEGEVRP